MFKLSDTLERDETDPQNRLNRCRMFGWGLLKVVMISKRIRKYMEMVQGC